MPSSIQLITEKNYTIDENGKKVLFDKINAGCQATCTTPNWALIRRNPQEPLSLDIEFQNYKPKGVDRFRERMGRVALVNTRGQVVYDVYVRYDFDPEGTVLLPPRRFNVSWPDLRLRNRAKTCHEVEENLRDIMNGRLIIGSGMTNDIKAVGPNVWQPDHLRYDCQHEYGVVNLAKLAGMYLEGSFDWHDPADDARMAMLLYLRLHSYDGRDSFKDPPFQYEEEASPSLGAKK